jgi:ABC-type Fe3+/spermidine/putrescine transport system ATPase subunit
MTDHILTVRDLTKHFGETKVVDRLDLDVHAGEMLAFLGPSGCGKTTTLRMISGLTRPSSGEIEFGGKPFVSMTRRIYLAPEKRNIGMVFQSYALWPHMTVAQNVGYPLRLRGEPAADIRRKVLDVLGLMGLQHLVDQTVPKLSGGQQQRVALARALVYRPSLVLFDEPFSNLDAALRGQMRLELKSLWRKVAMTGLFVTHDQIEALSLADRVAIMNGGRIEQIGTPKEVYSAPKTRFVRDFLGKVVNLHGTVEENGAAVRVAIGNGADGAARPMLFLDAPAGNGARPGDHAEISIRPEHVQVLREPGLPGGNGANGARNVLPGVIEDLLFTGDCYETRIRVADDSILLELPSTESWREGERLGLRFREDAMTLWRDEAPNA